MSEQSKALVDRDRLIDLYGQHSGGVLKSKRMIIAIIGTVLLYLLIGLIDMSQYGEN